MLLRRRGDIYDKLLNKLQFHSLAQLMVEMLAVKVVAGVSLDNLFEKDDDNEEEEDEEKEPKLSPSEQQMVDILNEKRQMVIQTLIDRVGPKCEDLEEVLNA